jgi:hypothetical protein
MTRNDGGDDDDDNDDDDDDDDDDADDDGDDNHDHDHNDDRRRSMSWSSGSSFGGVQLGWHDVLLLSSLFSCADEVATLALLKQDKHPKLSAVLFGEGVTVRKRPGPGNLSHGVSQQIHTRGEWVVSMLDAGGVMLRSVHQVSSSRTSTPSSPPSSRHGEKKARTGQSCHPRSQPKHIRWSG